jgi:hypothetical protein
VPNADFVAMPIKDEPEGVFCWQPTWDDRHQAVTNHSQTLAALQKRGGVRWDEMAAILEGRYVVAMEPDYARLRCQHALVRRDPRP